MCVARLACLSVTIVAAASIAPITIACADDSGVGWPMVKEIEARIQPPVFPDREFDVTDYGAAAGGETDCKPGIERAIEDCHLAGGGMVVVPPGEWFCAGPIHLQSNVNLHLREGATIRFSTRPTDYLPAVLTRFEGNEVMNYSPLVYAFEQENIAITGKGTLDGDASEKRWWSWKGGNWGNDQNQTKASLTLRQMAEDNAPPQERIFGEGHYLRPNFIQPYSCKNVLIEGVTITNSPMWVIHPVLCENVTVRKVVVVSHGPNSDGCDPECCRDVLIEDCFFDTGDDCIAIKSGRNSDGRRLGRPSENIVIRGCTMKDGHGGVVLGSEMSGGIQNVFAEDCSMDSPNLERAIRLKSNSMRGGYLKNLFVRNIQVGEVSDAVIRINLMYDKDRGQHYPHVSNIHIENVTSEKSKYPLYFVGTTQQPIENVVIQNCSFKNAKNPSIIQNVAEITLKDFNLTPD